MDGSVLPLFLKKIANSLFPLLISIKGQSLLHNSLYSKNNQPYYWAHFWIIVNATIFAALLSTPEMAAFSAFVTAPQKIGIHLRSVYPQCDKRLIRISEKVITKGEIKTWRQSSLSHKRRNQISKLILILNLWLPRQVKFFWNKFAFKRKKWQQLR